MNRQGAFTLIELAVTVALLSLVATIAVPALTDVIERNRQQAVMNQLQSLLQDARSRAVMNGKIVELCPSADGVNCVNDWTQPWLQRRLSDAQVYSHIAPAASNGPLHWAGFTESIRFYSNGTSPVSSGRFFQCHRNEVAWQLIISRQGRIRLASKSENTENAGRCH